MDLSEAPGSRHAPLLTDRIDSTGCKKGIYFNQVWLGLNLKSATSEIKHDLHLFDFSPALVPQYVICCPPMGHF